MNANTKSFLLTSAVAILVLAFAGCPGKAHLRPVPDYDNMTLDGGDGEPPEGDDVGEDSNERGD